MKKRIILSAVLFLAALANSFACTNLIVGKNASTDGRLLFPIRPTRMACLVSFIIIRLLHIPKGLC